MEQVKSKSEVDEMINRTIGPSWGATDFEFHQDWVVFTKGEGETREILVAVPCRKFKELFGK
jgi:hypothetical protein